MVPYRNADGESVPSMLLVPQHSSASRPALYPTSTISIAYVNSALNRPCALIGGVAPDYIGATTGRRFSYEFGSLAVASATVCD
jgi:hypothetical protein